MRGPGRRLEPLHPDWKVYLKADIVKANPHWERIAKRFSRFMVYMAGGHEHFEQVIRGRVYRVSPEAEKRLKLVGTN